ncbi:RodZ domain-containing protein [Pelosinus sp. IPA-1]|uniref:helix-turn-helix domain-containing protein n=1 Tax=Pelosinus sp. IPA-1 TaxID=3029569 RepID=UPI002436266D|nr:RodZ domain-containing protein [Pelosinus sp. IPA-1]GMA99380.1 XRE family transcriptional regulator [Pelosinus sp. IPA-1]
MQTVGEILRSEREKKGLSVKEIEVATSIRTLYITAIEEDNYSVIPGEVYLKGFIRNYSNYLGLNSQEIMDLYRKDQNPSTLADENLSPVSKVDADKPVNNNNNIPIKWITISLLALCAIGGTWWLLGSAKSIQEPNIEKQAQSTPTIPNQVTKEQSVTPVVPTVLKKPVTLTAKYTDQCWTLVTADNKIIYEGTPQAGDTLTWEAEQNIALKVGNAGGIDIVYNGQTMGKLGVKGEVLVKTYGK